MGVVNSDLKIEILWNFTIRAAKSLQTKNKAVLMKIRATTIEKLARKHLRTTPNPKTENLTFFPYNPTKKWSNFSHIKNMMGKKTLRLLLESTEHMRTPKIFLVEKNQTTSHPTGLYRIAQVPLFPLRVMKIRNFCALPPVKRIKIHRME
jgi:hypothetical protein